MWALQLPVRRCLLQATWEHGVGSGLTPCSDEVVALESSPFEGMGSGSSEHPVSRMARTAMLSTRPMIDFDIAFHVLNVPSLKFVGSSSLDLWIRWVSFAKITAAPAFYGAVGPHPAGVAPPGTDRDNYPFGGVAWPLSSSPQHSTEPSAFTPQVYEDPALTEANSPDGGVAWP